MLKLKNDNGDALGLLAGAFDIKIVSSLEKGNKTLSFKYPLSGAYSDEIKNECYIETKTDEYVIKSIKSSGNSLEVKAPINREELEGKPYASFKTLTKTCLQCMTEILDGTGWTLGVCPNTKKRTVSSDSACSALDLIPSVEATYNVEIEFCSKSKIVNVYESRGSDRGAYFTDSLNLRSVTAERTSLDFCTRLIPLGKNGVGIDIDGKNYVEDHSYSDKIITRIWQDNRYTNPESLIEDARIKLAETAKPYEAYEADVIDLAKQSGIYKNILDYAIGDTVTLVSRSKKIHSKMRIVEMTEYPLCPDKNSCQLANKKKKAALLAAEKIETAKNEAINTAEATANEIVDEKAEEITGFVAAREAATAQLNSIIANSIGLHMSAITGEGGGKVYYFHDKATLAQSSIIYTFGTGGFAWTNSWNGGNPVWNYGITSDGNAILNYLTVNKLTAEQIDAENLEVNAANIKGELTIGQLPDNIADTSDIPTHLSDLYDDSDFVTESGVTSIIDGRITTDYIEALGIAVDAAKVNGKLTAEQIETDSLFAQTVATGNDGTPISVESMAYFFDTSDPNSGIGTILGYIAVLQNEVNGIKARLTALENQ